MTREMKDSGIEFIGNIPEEWGIRRYKHFAISGMGSTILKEELSEDGVPVYSATQDDKIFGYINNPNIILIKDDFVIPARGNSIGCITFVKHEKATCTQTTIYSKINKGINKRFLYYCGYGLKDNWFEFDNTAIPQITVRQVQNNKVPYPSLQIQQRIADYLDEKCKEIDSIIENTKSTIEEYKKYKYAIVADAVTKGLWMSIDFRDSSVDWIGIMPRHWQLIKIKYLFSVKKDIANKLGYDILSVTQTGLKIKDISNNEGQISSDYSKYQIVEPNDFVMNHMDLLTGWVDCSAFHGVTSPDYRVFKLNDEDKALREYFKYVFQLCYKHRIFYGLGQGVSNLGRWRLQTDKFINFEVPLPPIDEQKRIVEFLDKKCEEIDTLISKKQQILSELESYKKSLIYECVTGKTEV